MSSRLPTPPGMAPRVALVRSRYDPAGGAERFVQAAVKALREQGVALTIVTRHWPGGDGTALVVDPFHVGGLWRDWSFARAACGELSRRHFDLVQSHERIPCCDVYRAGDGVHAQWLLERARTQSRPMAWATRHAPRHLRMLAAERALFTSPRLRAVICNSEMVRSEIARHFGTPADRLVLIRNAVDGATFHPAIRDELALPMRAQLKIPREAFVLAHVGSGFERKGVATFVRAVAAARCAPWGIVAGRDKHTARYVALARRLGVADRIRFVGAVSEVRAYYAAADAFLLATLYDPQPNAALEAMACGLPVITTPRCGAAELLVEGVSGHIRDALDVQGMADAIDGIANGGARRMGAAAAEAVAPYTPRRMGAEYVALYQRLLHR